MNQSFLTLLYLKYNFYSNALKSLNPRCFGFPALKQSTFHDSPTLIGKQK